MSRLLTLLRKKGADFSPLDLPGLALWLDASDESTITHDTGAVSQWDDKSGNGFHVTQGTASLQPATGVATENGLNTLSFAEDMLKTSGNFGVSNATNFTVFAVAKSTVTVNYSTYLSIGPAATARDTAAFIFLNTTPVAEAGRPRMAVDSYAPRGMYGSTKIDVAQSNVLVSRIAPWSAMTTSSEMWLNGEAQTATAYGVLGVSLSDGPVYVGRINNITSTYWTGTISELIVCKSAVPDTQIAIAEAYLSDKWGVTLA